MSNSVECVHVSVCVSAREFYQIHHHLKLLAHGLRLGNLVTQRFECNRI